MLSVHHVHKSFGIEKILDDITLSVNQGERWGLIGPNGCGKSTLLRILAGEEPADQGSFEFSPPTLRLGYLSQGLKFQPDDTLGSFLTRMEGDLPLLEGQLGQLAEDLQEYFQRQRPFLDPDLDLQQVAAATGYSRNQISHLLNQVLGQSFYRYVNQARLQHLLAALDGATPPIRIDELAFAAGFNSLSAFYSCFRQHTGLSPKAYVKQISLRARAQDDD